MKYKITNIHTGKSNRGREHTIYASLYNQNGVLEVSASLAYILQIVRDRGWIVEGVSYIDPDFCA
jgi:hypothetical protein